MFGIDILKNSFDHDIGPGNAITVDVWNQTIQCSIALPGCFQALAKQLMGTFEGIA